MRRRLLAERESFASGTTLAAAQQALGRHLAALLVRLEPSRLGLYCPVRSEFNAIDALTADSAFATLPLALPYSRREPRAMHYRAWDRRPPGLLDECAIPACDGAEVLPDVVLAPCVGFTRCGYRLGYGGGYFDRFAAAHPHVTAIGVAWAISEVDEAEFGVQPHDRALMLIVTENGVV